MIWIMPSNPTTQINPVTPGHKPTEPPPSAGSTSPQHPQPTHPGPGHHCAPAPPPPPPPPAHDSPMAATNDCSPQASTFPPRPPDTGHGIAQTSRSQPRPRRPDVLFALTDIIY